MTGFLTHIAARLGEPEGQLRPRRPSLFEPAVPAAPDFALAGAPAEGLPDGAFDAAVETDAPAVGMPAPSALPARQRRTGPGSAAARPADPDHSADPSPDAVDVTPVARDAAPRRTAQRALADEAAAGPGMVPDMPVPKGPGCAIRPTRIAASPPTVPADPAGPVEDRPSPARRHPAQPLPRRDDAAAPVDRRPDVAAPMPAPPASGILQVPVAARIAAGPPPARAHRAEPEIHVTIGRVEVRAEAAPPADAARPARPSPVMSLDDYLRTRRGRP